MGGKGSKAKKRSRTGGVPGQRGNGVRGASGPARVSDFAGSQFRYAAAQQSGTQYNTFVQQYAPVPAALDALPDLPPEFTGRDEDLAPLLELLDPESGVSRPVAAVAGMGGVGKTTLAYAVGHAVLERNWFTGVLLVDLRGYDPQPAQAEQSLDALLRRLGVPPEHIPPTDREVFYRSHLADRGRKGERLLVIADNASSAAQVKPLLPPTPHGLIATSRKALPGIGRPRPLQVLQREDAVALLGLALREANPHDRRVEDDHEAAERVAVACGCLPLALQIVAALLVQDPEQPLSERAERLTSDEDRLDSINDGERDLRTVFDQTLDSLLPQQQNLFRLLSLNAGPDISTSAAAALTHQTETTIDNQLGQLTAAHLLSRSTVRGRWQMHDLLRDYAKEQTRRYLDDNRTARRKFDQARQRLIGHYVKRAESARTHIDFSSQLQLSGDFEDREAAYRWVDEERATLIATAHSAAPSVESARLCFALTEYLQYRDLRHDALAMSALSLDSLRAIKDRRNEPGAWSNLGYALQSLHRYDEALTAHTTARDLYEEAGDVRGQAVAWNNTGDALRQLHRYEEAFTAHTTARAFFERIGNAQDLAIIWDNVGNTLESLHRYEDALAAHATARELYEENDDVHGQAVAWNNTGDALRLLFRSAEALSAYDTARTLYEETGDVRGVAVALDNRGNALENLYRSDEALVAHTAARRLFEETGDVGGQAAAWNNTGDTLRKLHRYEEALQSHATARRFYEENGDLRGLATAWSNTAHSLRFLHRHEEALSAYTTARDLFVQTGDALRAASAQDQAGNALEGLNRYEEALAAHSAARAAFEDSVDRRGLGATWNNTGDALRYLHRNEEALDAYVIARGLCEETSDAEGQAVVWNNINAALRQMHRYDEALAASTAAHALFGELGSKGGMATSSGHTGSALEGLDRYEEALDAHAAARALYEEERDAQGVAVTYNNTGTALRGLGRYDEAVEAGRRSAEDLESLGDLTGAGEALSELATTLSVSGASPEVVKEAWLRSAHAYDRAGAMEKRDQSRAAAEAIGE
ncbi:tetratricopeptide repeat protein [Streptomyces bauhiniae]|uniref:tetratricopeptide repeat protein n=1 Tax=Streptomyces bauhiniae TaxID=2340725 RepID=UPI0034563816